jgi:hypothetical protein
MPSFNPIFIRFHFDSLAHDNDALSSSLSYVSLPSDKDKDTLNPILANGMQKVRKFNAVEEDIVFILMAIFRLESRGVDLVLTENVPLSRDSSSLNEERIETTRKTFCEIAQSLSILNYDLFA